MPNDVEQRSSRGFGIAAMAVACAVVAAAVYVLEVTAELRDVGAAARSEMAAVRAALGQQPSSGRPDLAANVECVRTPDMSGAIQSIQAKLGALTDSLAQVQATLKQMSAKRERQAKKGTALPLGLQPLSPPSPPGFGANPAQLLHWRNTASAEQREKVDAIMRDHAARVRHEIAAQSTDPSRPDFEVVSRVMQESQAEMAEELRAALPPEDFEALFPAEQEQGSRPNTATLGDVPN